MIACYCIFAVFYLACLLVCTWLITLVCLCVGVDFFVGCCLVG